MVLVSREGIRFRVHRIFLTTGSTFFKNLLSLPQSRSSDLSNTTIEPLDERAETIAGLLAMLSGKKLPSITTFPTIERLLYTAEKWDMPGPLSVLKELLWRPEFSSNPIALYVLACRMGWGDVAERASNLSLGIDLTTPEACSILRKLDAVDDLLRLQEFHRNGAITNRPSNPYK